MSGTQPDRHLGAQVRRSRISWVWLIPLVAAVIAAFLFYRRASDEGPLITLSFAAGDGLVAGQTRVRHKAVELGLVESIRLADDMSHVVVTVRMRKEADPYLTDKARFWVVRARLSSGSLSGIETLVSGSYIEMDPGERDGQRQDTFIGLEQPPGVRSGEPGRTYQVRAERIGSLGPGAPVFYRDIKVGEVLGYDIGDGLGPVTLSIFVRAPFDDFVREGSNFWNASGLSVQVGSGGVHVELASLQAVLAGGVAFDAGRDAAAKPVADGAQFDLYRDQAAAEAARYTSSQTFVVYFESSVRGLGPGAAVEFYGIQVGMVRAVELDVNTETAQVRARVRLDIQPERISLPSMPAHKDDPVEVAARLVRRGMRAQLVTASYLTGQLVLALDFVPNAPPAELTREGKDWVIPSQGGGLANILSAVSDIASKLDRLPLDQIGANLNGTLKAASGAMVSIQDLANKANSGLTPTFQRLPAIVSALQDAVGRAGRVFASIDNSYGSNSQFQRELDRAMIQVGDTARSIRLLADFLDRHPEALVRGRAGVSSVK
ncbi:MAG: MlaD family protein [Acetobacteraceae bacterium]